MANTLFNVYIDGVLQTEEQTQSYSEIIQVATTKILGLSDAGTYQNCTNTSPTDINIEIPLNATVAIPITTEIIFERSGTGEVNFTVEVGVTLLSEGSKVQINALYQTVVLKKKNTNTWVLFGALK